ncbi:Phosphopantothenoylcysteine decarboxylase; Phosphopantothenate-cysteine ligase [Coriobacterium glomerans PW2]|uniref:Coenzyme A biosynthesis bifunctional protein CoaBC n=1 Tax=Coriobacterium glomerans (strain ATCC 49209 / DSM 20642 / JCM 10262 / PW2) TaxID=700015 RepID=F2N9J8_CORGP|nr:bifunctional phosphopantothenoylcysteine decarboxylase/phosphopantothenate--cysteine ligase CoaBC [Coriobacterium glomerans]AEB07027.1 Phosphopantothenoylcysteine decarboxylase; Phosphopantothenate-cysteine ligase [Coriobacterium glomerans PW2]
MRERDASVPAGADIAVMSGSAQGPHAPAILLCVTGCIAAYKSCEIARLLQKRGVDVTVAMSEHATRLVDPLTFRALTRRPVAVGLFDDPSDPIKHISLAQAADVVLVAPATANIIAKMAHGIADDLISTTLLATALPILIAPAMNVNMWRAAATQANIEVLRARGAQIISPDAGYLACGDIGEGRLADPCDIVERVMAALGSKDATERAPRSRGKGTDGSVSDSLAGERIVITAGPTYEPIDPVRFIGNRSSGKMGVELARAAYELGAEVTLVLGPTTIAPPEGVCVERVETAEQMLRCARSAFADATALICAAAVSDYAAAEPAAHKLKKGTESLESLRLVRTPDILAQLSAEKGERRVIGFAAETERVVDNAREKLQRKGCDAIVANDVALAGSGFNQDMDRAWWVGRAGVCDLGFIEKRDLAFEILRRAYQL